MEEGRLEDPTWAALQRPEFCVELQKQAGGGPILPLNHCRHRRLL